MEKLKNKNGITLITLVVTIIILLILAGVTINLTLGEHGIIKMAEKAGKDYQNASAYEKNELNKLYSEMTNGNKTEDPKTQPIVSVGADTHEVQEIKYSWEELSKLAKIISDNYGEETGKINNNTAEVKVNTDGKEYTLGIGDWTTLNGKKIRILGFNHDTLSSKNAYGGTNTYAGISFEFAESIMISAMNSNGKNEGGWGVCELRTTLNSTTYNGLENKNYIKEVNKQYIQTYNDSGSVTTSQDKLWLLSCSEIWNNGKNGQPYGLAVAGEGEQYKYYQNINADATKNNDDIKKKNDDWVAIWWLRSPYYEKNYYFCEVDNYGDSNAYDGMMDYAIAPGFAI